MIDLGARRRDDEASRAMGATMKLSARRHDDEAWRAMGATIKLSARRRDDEDMRDGKTTHPQRWEGGEHPRPKASRRRDPTQRPPPKDDGEKELLPPDCEEERQPVPTATRVLRVPCSGGGDCDEAACALLERTNRGEIGSPRSRDGKVVHSGQVPRTIVRRSGGAGGTTQRRNRRREPTTTARG